MPEWFFNLIRIQTLPRENKYNRGKTVMKEYLQTSGRTFFSFYFLKAQILTNFRFTPADLQYKKKPTQHNPDQPWSHLESANPDHFPPNDCLLHSPFKSLAAVQIFLLFLSPTHPSWQPSWGRTNLRSRKLSFPAWKSSSPQGKSWALVHFQGKTKTSKLSKPHRMRTWKGKIQANQKTWFYSKDFKTNIGFKWSGTSSVILWPLPGRDLSRATPPLVSSAIHCHLAFQAGTIISGWMLSLLLTSCALISPS